MTTSLTRRLGISERELGKLNKSVGPLKVVTEFFTDAIYMLEKSGAAHAIGQAVPWLVAAGHDASVAVPPIAFLAKLLHRVSTEADPEALGYLACTLAYERSVEQAILAIGEPRRAKELSGDMRKVFDALKPAQELDFSTFRLDAAFQHPFIKESDAYLDAFAAAAGYDRTERLRLQGDVHSRFIVNMKTILSHGHTRERFAPFTERLKLGGHESLSYEALYEHADLQRRQYEELPVLGTEAFPLSHVYVDLDCGRLAWGDIRDGAQAGPQRPGDAHGIDPFKEHHGGRHPLLDSVMDLIGDPAFREAIVIQGVAGAGKSAFTLRLSAELIHQGLRPIRVRMRDLQFDRHAGEAIRQAVKLGDESGNARVPDDLFLRGAIWNESVSFRRARICPYVLILDGWDEISVSVTEGFRVRLDRMLEQVRSEFLSNRDVPVRVIVTGRPSTALTEGSFLRDHTMILTMRPFRPEHLDTFIKMLADALKRTPDHAEKWTIPDPKRFKPVQRQYKRDFKAQTDDGGDTRQPRGSMDVLGLPLLAHIAMRLMSSYPGELAELVKSPTVLYRNLVDLTCERAGQVGRQALEPAARPRLTGAPLRNLLRKTAAAIAVHGDESISYVELQRRLRLDPKDLETRAEQATSDNVLTALMISFYFKGGHRDLGCEFVHKSFREYLFAEAIVETVKEGAKLAPAHLPIRRPYWHDFDEEDPRYAWSRSLAELLAPQWLGIDVVGHVEQLLAWEIARSSGKASDLPAARSTEPLRLVQWEAIRDGLADLWDHWAEGVHLRPQPKRLDRGGVGLNQPTLADRLVDWSAPQSVEWGDAKLAPARTLTIDAHLGDALFRLTAATHFQIARQEGWLERSDTPAGLWEGAGDVGSGGRRHQVEIRGGTSRWVLFSPSGDNGDYLSNYMMRINSAGWRPGGPFPLGCDARGLDLRGVSFTIPSPQTPARRGLFRHANLSGASAIGSCFFHTALTDALLREAILDRADLTEADLNNADLREACLGRADLRNADLRGAKLSRADLACANLRGAKLGGADLSEADLAGADLRDADLAGADLSGARLRGADLRGAKVTAAELAVASTDDGSRST